MIHRLRATLTLTGQVVGGFSMKGPPDECDSRTTHLNHMIEERSSRIGLSTRLDNRLSQLNTTEGVNEKAGGETLLHAKRANENV